MLIGWSFLRGGGIRREAAGRFKVTIDGKACDEASDQVSVRVACGIDQNAEEGQIVSTAQVRSGTAQRGFDGCVQGGTKRSTISQKLETLGTPRRDIFALVDDESHGGDEVGGEAEVWVVRGVL